MRPELLLAMRLAAEHVAGRYGMSDRGADRSRLRILEAMDALSHEEAGQLHGFIATLWNNHPRAFRERLAREE